MGVLPFLGYKDVVAERVRMPINESTKRENERKQRQVKTVTRMVTSFLSTSIAYFNLSVSLSLVFPLLEEVELAPPFADKLSFAAVHIDTSLPFELCFALVIFHTPTCNGGKEGSAV